ncbi:MAG: carboxypeptidase-like regulatory domain-containing protein [Endomicrobium sp.]|nr:carboxypeptidase-like regulatory domain-containing protein [Endomicrobium sp.]
MKKNLIISVFTVFIFVNCSFALSLSGRVVNIRTNRGQQNITISAVSASLSEDKLKAVTDSEGVFIVSGLKKNTEYILKTESAKDSLVFPKNNTVHTGKKDIENFNFAYYPKYSVSGKVSGEVKTKGLTIMFKSGSPFHDNSLSSIDENGVYKADGLIYGQEYDAFVNSDFQIYGVLGGGSIMVFENSVKDMKITPLFYAAGIVFNAETGAGLAGVAVKAVSSDGSHEQTAVSYEDGSFVMSGLYYGESYTVTAEPQAGFEIPSEVKTGTVSSTVTGLNFPFIRK